MDLATGCKDAQGTGVLLMNTSVRLRILYVMLYLFIGGMGNYFTIWLRDVGFEDSDIGWQGSIRFFCL